MTKKLVALDLDDLIFPFIETVVPFINMKMNSNIAVDEVYSMNFEDVWGHTRADSVQMMEEFFSQLDNTPRPIDGSIEAVKRLNEAFDLAIITSRTDAMRDRTLDWLEMHFPGTFLEVHLTNNWVTDGRPTKRKKVDVCVELDAIALVDDNLDHVGAVVEKGITGVLFGDFAWNRDLEIPAGIIRAFTWDEVTEELLALQ